jgi:hypothetical protein
LGRTPSSSSAGAGGGPRLHDYALPAASISKAAELRPGLLGVPTPPSATPVPGSGPASPYARPGMGFSSGSFTDSSFALSPGSERGWLGSSPATSVSVGLTKGFGALDMAGLMDLDMDDDPAAPVHTPGSWSLPASDLRSSSAYERSSSEGSSDLSRDAVKEEEEDEDEDEFAVGRREGEDEWAGDMDMD